MERPSLESVGGIEFHGDRTLDSRANESLRDARTGGLIPCKALALVALGHTLVAALHEKGGLTSVAGRVATAGLALVVAGQAAP